MSKTIFWYLFRDLLRIFLMASGALAAIMSFGGLLRPLTENGLDAAQVGKMLTYLTPAMMTYSLPVAALFATTVVYGRLAADNELTACRAAGMSYTAIGLPAVVLGLCVAILSLALLCFIVPVFSLKVEQVIGSNLAQVIVNKIERNHQIRVSAGDSGTTTVFAEEARMLPQDTEHPGDELVQLIGPAIVTYQTEDKESHLRIPKDFLTAQSAIVRLQSFTGDSPEDSGQISMDLIGGAKFPREFTGTDRSQVGVDTVTFGPVPMPNPIRENVKFMDLWRLLHLAADPSSSQRVSSAVAALVRRDQERAFLQGLTSDASGLGQHAIVSAGANGQTYIVATEGTTAELVGSEMVFTSAGVGRQVKLTVIRGEQTTRTAEAKVMRARARADNPDNLMIVSLELTDLTMRTPDVGMQGEPAELATWTANIDVPMDDAIRDLRRTRTLAAYAADPDLDAWSGNLLRREQVVVNNAVRGELHGRASFAMACLILVLVGTALGMMFRSGSFLTAFAVSFIPAMLCIALVVAGQQTADHVPLEIGPKFLLHNRPLQLGIALIWSGNAMVLVLATALVMRLRRR